MTAKIQITILFLLAVFLTSPSTAQDSPGAIGSVAASHQQLFLDIDFEGGTVNDYVTLLRKLDPGVRILCSEAAVMAHVPSIKIKSVPVRVAVNALWTVTRNSFRPIMIEEDNFKDKDHQEGLVFSIDLDSPSEEIKMEATVVSAKHALKALGSENAAKQLQSTIESGLSTVFSEHDGPAVVVKLHEPTSLLFVKGPVDRVTFVLEIIDQLSQNSVQ